MKNRYLLLISVETQCLYFVIKDNKILRYVLNCIIIPCKVANKLPSHRANELEQTNKLANQQLINEQFTERNTIH